MKIVRYAALGVLLTATLLLVSRSGSAEANFQKQLQKDASFTAQEAVYSDLLVKVGPRMAQDILQRSMPPNSRTHTLNHVSGAYLYRTEGAEGIFLCRNYFNGSCYHGFISAIVADRGPSSIESVLAVCREDRPLEQARECSHGMGHALLMQVGYENLPEALEACRATFPTSAEAQGDCDDGVFMENNFGGFSEPPANRWYKPEDPLYPCNDPRVSHDSVARNSCWFMQSQATLNSTMYPRFNGEISLVADYCSELPETDGRVCTQGLARQIQAIAGSDTALIETLCSEASPQDPTQCYSDAAESAYGFGAEATGIALCEKAGRYRGECYQQLIKRISSTAEHDLAGRLRACHAFPDPIYRDACTAYARAHS